MFTAAVASAGYLTAATAWLFPNLPYRALGFAAATMFAPLLLYFALSAELWGVAWAGWVIPLLLTVNGVAVTAPAVVAVWRLGALRQQRLLLPKPPR